jgi:tRNA threonylcarbamoyl adenosine modification protein YeaZ
VVLAFDCSAAHCAAALLSDGRVLVSVQEPMETGQAERLMPLLEEMLAEQGLGWRDLGGIGVGTGPGNFTGVRIAVSAARGLALGLGIPAVGVTVLEARAFGLPGVTVIEDARRGEVYLAMPGGVPRLARLDEIGPGGPVTGSAAAQTGRAVVATAVPLAEAIARIAAGRLGTRQPRPAPFYLRGPDAALPTDPPPVIRD